MAPPAGPEGVLHQRSDLFGELLHHFDLLGVGERRKAGAGDDIEIHSGRLTNGCDLFGDVGSRAVGLGSASPILLIRVRFTLVRPGCCPAFSARSGSFSFRSGVNGQAGLDNPKRET